VNSVPEDTILIVFLKNQLKGKVKTRLAKSIGDDIALSIYKDLTRLTLKAAAESQLQVHVFFSDSIETTIEGFRQEFATHLQRGNDLGERMLNAFLEFDRDIPKIIIGSDCSEITANLLKKAAHSLIDHNAVIGPSLDGGYYLLGFKQVLNQVFINKQWSTNSVSHETLQDLKTAQYNCYEMEPHIDVDDLTSLQASSLWEKYRSYIEEKNLKS